MSSSIFPSDKRGFAFLVTLLVVSAVSWAYTTYGNPEIAFWRQAFEVKRTWAGAVRKADAPLVVFAGGSSTAFQMDSGLLQREYDAATVNAGMHAGMGVDATIALASTLLKDGDRLVLMSEPYRLAEGGGSFTGLGAQMLWVTGARKEAYLRSSLQNVSDLDLLLKCRPGLNHSMVMTGKLLLRRPLYRYSAKDIHDGGYLTTAFRQGAIQSQNLEEYRLSERGRQFLLDLRRWADARHIEVVYMMPVSYVSTELLERQRQANRSFLKEIAEILPVWEDSRVGAWPRVEDFADTPQHLTFEAAQVRTREIGDLYFRK